VFDVVARLKNTLQADYAVVGGGNTRRLATLPPDTFRGSNENARTGGVRLWQTEMKQLQPSSLS
jgi:hypothetical protein